MIIKTLKRILPIQVVNRLVILKQQSINLSLVFFSSHPFLSTCYYMLFSRAFDREHHAVLQGRLNYRRQHQRFDVDSSALLRRNIHRLEKGLIMQPRKPTFAADYIGETVSTFVEMAERDDFCQGERQWANDVLGEYFSVVTDNAAIANARTEFLPYSEQAKSAFIPFADHLRVRSRVTDVELERLFRQRRSTRWFDAKSIEDAKLDRAIELASWAPSACNRQPFQFYVANGLERAVPIAKMAVGTGGFAENINCIIAVVGNLAAYPFEKDRHLIYIDGSLAAMQLMLAIETLGMASCPLNWPDVDKNEIAIANHLQLSPDKRVVMLLAVGYAQSEGKIPYSQKKTSAKLRVNV